SSSNLSRNEDKDAEVEDAADEAHVNHRRAEVQEVEPVAHHGTFNQEQVGKVGNAVAEGGQVGGDQAGHQARDAQVGDAAPDAPGEIKADDGVLKADRDPVPDAAAVAAGGVVGDNAAADARAEHVDLTAVGDAAAVGPGHVVDDGAIANQHQANVLDA